LDRLVELEGELGRVQAEQVAVLARIGELSGGPGGMGADLVSCILRVGIRTAQQRIAIALTLTRELPRTRSALQDGQLPFTHARAIAEASWQLPSAETVGPAADAANPVGAGEPSDPVDTSDPANPAHADGLAARLEAAVLARAVAQTLPQLRAALARAVIRIDPATAEQRHRTARADRHLRLQPEPDGMASLTAYLPAPHAHAIYQRLTHAATGLPRTDPRSRDQRRADLFTAHLLGAPPEPPDPAVAGASERRRPGLEPFIQVIVSASTLLGQDEDPGWLQRYGPITAATARELAHDPTGTWHRLLTDPAGQLLAYGTGRYRPPAALGRHVALRDATCVYPTCQQPAHKLDLDHITPYGQPEGTTDPANLAPLGRRHHNYKTQRKARYHRNPEGSYTWTIDTPMQRTHTNHPPIRWQPPRTGPTGERAPGESGPGESLPDELAPPDLTSPDPTSPGRRTPLDVTRRRDPLNPPGPPPLPDDPPF
jgi:hypothetical protein